MGTRAAPADAEKVSHAIDRGELVRLSMDLCDLWSPTGEEGPAGRFVYDWLRANGFEAVLQEFEPGRFNAVGILRGEGAGCSLMFNGHLDVSEFGSGRIEKSFVRDGMIYGEGIANMKGSVASFLMAGKALLTSGARLKGDLILAAVGGEISLASVGPHQSPRSRGEGIGTKYLLSHGIESDYAVVADGSEFSVVRAQAGVAYFRIGTSGHRGYTPFTARGGTIAESTNAIVKMARIVEALEGWASEYERKNRYEFPGGVLIPKVNIGAIEAGSPTKPGVAPGECNIYVDVRLAPGCRPLAVEREIRDLLARLDIDTSAEMYLSQLGYEGKGSRVEGLAETVANAHRAVFGSDPPSPTIPTASMWTDTNLYWEIGIPAVKFGPCQEKYPNLRMTEIEELVKTAQIDALIALTVCNRDRER
ncbi:MAG: M20/M25/M40 family metallo-hydrolase [Deltaproteobacteria bacterium]|nr:M20/M25/M40 family metallo-hydrolase [Deltaproteobacteria bacterium]